MDQAPVMDVRGKRVLVVGLGRSGLAAASLLRLKGAIVTVSDARPAPEFHDQVPDLIAQKIGLELGVHRLETFLGNDLLVVSPGVRWDLPQLRAARSHGIPAYTEVEVATWFLKGTLVGITGTNGKTTTTTLLSRILQRSGFSTFVGGNIGVPLITAVEQTAQEAFLVTELSSFQLEAAQYLRPHVAVLLNLTPNHLDRHPSFESYISAKAQIFRNQTAEDYAILNADDPNVMGLAPALASTRVLFSRQQELPDGVFVAGDEVVYRVRNLERTLLHRSDIHLRGEFNIENVLAASAAACVLGADFDAIRKAVAEFQGVEHRLEFVREIMGVQFYNDSKATSVDATAKALSAFDGGVNLIMGGKDKGAPYEPLRPLIKSKVKGVFLIGSGAQRISSELAGAGEFTYSGDLETAVRQAFDRADPGEVVLLAPGCASFDQFRDFEQRGEAFKEVVERLARKAKHLRIGNQEPGSGGFGVSTPETEAGNSAWGVGSSAAETANRTVAVQAPEVRRGGISNVPGTHESAAGPASAGPPVDTQDLGVRTAQQDAAGLDPHSRAGPGGQGSEIIGSGSEDLLAARGYSTFGTTERMSRESPLDDIPLTSREDRHCGSADILDSVSFSPGSRQVLDLGELPISRFAARERLANDDDEAVNSDSKFQASVPPGTRPSRPLDLISVYETGAEEFAAEADFAGRIPQAFEPLEAGDLRPLEIVRDEPLLYEIVAARAAAQTELFSPSQGSPGVTRSSRKRRYSSSAESLTNRRPGKAGPSGPAA